MEDPEIVPFDNDVKQQIEDDSEVREATRVLPFRKQFLILVRTSSQDSPKNSQLFK